MLRPYIAENYLIREGGRVSPSECDRAPFVFVKAPRVMDSPLAALRHRGAVRSFSCEMTDVHLGDRYARFWATRGI
jgi:hypothetical protein